MAPLLWVRCHLGLTPGTMVTRTPSGIVRVWRVETAENLADDDKYCLLTLFREWLWVCNFHKCHHPSLGTAQRGQQTHTAKKLLSPKMKIVLNFRLADPIQAQRLYEAQRDLRPLHRQQEADTQQKVRTEDSNGGYKPERQRRALLGQIILFSPGC